MRAGASPNERGASAADASDASGPGTGAIGDTCAGKAGWSARLLDGTGGLRGADEYLHTSPLDRKQVLHGRFRSQRTFLCRHCSHAKAGLRRRLSLSGVAAGAVGTVGTVSAVCAPESKSGITKASTRQLVSQWSLTLGLGEVSSDSEESDD